MLPWVVAAALLLLPVVAMQFTEAMDWGASDFLVVGALLFGACGAFELAARMTGNTAYRAAVGVAIVAALLLVWINLAVGIIGSEDNPANLMYAGVLGIAIVGALLANFRPNGTARALVATALAQVLVGVVALVLGWGSDGENWPQVIVFLNGFFAALWIASAALFRRAAQQQAALGRAALD